MTSDADVKKVIAYVTSSLISVLFLGNIFFITHLVSKIEAVVDEVWNLRQQITILTYRLDEIQPKK